MKRKVKLFIIALMLMLTSGCVKFNVSMDIKKDKSMNFSMLYALDESYAGSSGFELEDETSVKENIKNKNCSIESYNESNMLGYKVTCKVANIDDMSSEKDLDESDLESILTNEKSKLFTLKKGFFKNTYSVKLKSDTDLLDSSDYSNREEDDITLDDEDYDDDDYDYDDEDSDYDEDDYNFDDIDDYYEYSTDAIDDSETDSDIDLSALSSMDLKFDLKLPYKAISSNATTKEDNGKHLVWDFMEMSQSDDGNSDVEFKFALYNTTNIVLTIVIGVLVIAGLVFFIIKKKKNKNVTGVTNNNGMVNPINGPQDMFGNNFPINSTSVTVVPTETNASNVSTVNDVKKSDDVI